MKKGFLSMKKPLAVMLAAAVTLGFCPTPVEAAKTEYKYVYAGLNWAEYWANEDVYLANGSSLTDGSDEKDARGELDKGAFDVVSRATTNHGLHRGSYQCDAVIYDTDNKTYEISYWDKQGDDVVAVLTDGNVIKFAKGNITYTENGEEKTAVMDHYEVKGIKYVPVAVKAEDYDTFCQKYSVTENAFAVAGGYSEANLQAYSKTAEVTADTNGLKTAVKNEDGSFSFTKRAEGSGSGLKDEAQKTASNIVVTVREADDAEAYGAFLRVDLTGDGYGDLGANMYAVRWDYYGNDSSRTTCLGSYGTKFAADNWMHKSMGIQLGLTESLRCQLPEGTDGTGYWNVTVYAMGYKDYTFQIEAAADNIVKAGDDVQIDTAALQAAVDSAKKLQEKDYTAKSWANMQQELAEAEEELKDPHTQATVNEAIHHLNDAVKNLVKAEQPIETEKPAQPGTDPQTKTFSGKTKITSARNIKGKKAVLKWKKVKDADGYVVYRATKKNGKYKAVKTIKSAKTVKFTNSKLKKGKTYYYKVQAYKVIDKKKVMGRFCAVKKVKISK